MKHLHDKLGITFKELGALLGARELMARNLMEHNPGSCPSHVEAHEFNMGIALKKVGCGTIGCIGGTMAFLMGEEGTMYVGNNSYSRGQFSEALRPLFFPPKTYGDWADITLDKGVSAIDNFLRDGKPKWNDILRPKDAVYVVDMATLHKLRAAGFNTVWITEENIPEGY